MLRVGVIGTGAIGTEHARALARRVSGAELVAVHDVDVRRAESVAAEHGVIAAPTAAALVERDNVDAVVIASAAVAHASQVHACLAAGKPVLCEKPLAASVDDAWAVVEAEAALGRRLVQVGFMRRFDPGYVAVKSAIDSGRVGTPLLVHCAHRNPSVPPDFTSANGLTDSAVHEFDIVRWLLGDEITAVRVLRPRTSPRAASSHVDPQFVVVETASGVLVTIELMLTEPFGYDVRCQVVGSDGIVELENPRRTSTVAPEGHVVAVPGGWFERFGDTYRIEVQAWVDSIASGVPTGASAWDGYVAAAVADAAVASLDGGDRVPVTLRQAP